jgi:DNA-binding NtrC family response regulator
MKHVESGSPCEKSRRRHPEELSMEQVRSSGHRPTLKLRLEAYERRLIEEALIATGGNQRRAARALGVLPTTLHEKMKRLGLLNRSSGSDLQSRTDSPFLVA